MTQETDKAVSDMPTDPVERVIHNGLVDAGINFTMDQRRTKNLDFLLPESGTYIEVCQFHTPRKIEQCSRVDNVILIQGMDAAKAFRLMISRTALSAAETLMGETK